MWQLLRLRLDSDRQLLRTLCVLAMMGVAASVAIPLFILLVFLRPDLVRLVFFPPGPMLLGLTYLMIAAAWLVLFLPRCARCDRPLFSNRRSITAAFQGREHMARDYRAETLFGSYRDGAIWTMARTGNLTCMWCGHRVGDAPEFNIVRTEE